MTIQPVVSVILYGFNVAAFVEETVRSLLDQKYGNIEFYFSDDGSTDGTFEIIERICAWSGRPIILARNDTNKGICNQINAGVARTSGDLVMLANADDIYPQDYVRTLVDAWTAETPRPTIVWADLEQIDARGVPLGKVLRQRLAGTMLRERVASRCDGPRATGVLFNRAVFDQFGPLPDNLSLEDSCINLRAFLLGRPLHIERPIVRYRVHTGNISQVYATGEFDAWAARRSIRMVWQTRQGHRAFIEMLRDMHQRPSEVVPELDLKQARWVAIEKIAETAMLADYYSGDRAIGDGARWATLFRLARLQIKLTLKRWFPFIERRNLRWEYKSYAKGH